MADVTPLPESTGLASSPQPAGRDELLARYRTLREISKHHHREVLKFISQDSILQQARRLGLAQGKTFMLHDMDELDFVFDLAIHTAPEDRSRAIDRYARSVGAAPGSDELVVLDAMRSARFSILRVERRHELAGLIVEEFFRETESWLIDIGLESSVPDGALMATRLYTPERFSMTAGIIVPFDPAIAADLAAELPRHMRAKRMADVVDDRRFAERVYRSALANGVMERTRFQDLPDDAA